ncbi:MAG TPA: O-antigen ligase family protein [Terriglobales bacterium]|jgi:O-antigen ligase
MAQATTPLIFAENLRRTSSLENAVLYSTFGLLLFGPLAFGSTEPWSILVLEVCAALLLAVWCFAQFRHGTLEIVGNPLFAPMAAFGIVIVLQLVSGQSSYRYDTLSSFHLYAAFAVLCFLIVQLLRRSSQIEALARTISTYGFAVAVFGIVQGISSNGKLYWLREPRFGGWIYGPYVNHNHYAGLMELLVPIPLVVSLNEHAHRQTRKMALVAASVMATSVFLSGSRGGMAAFAVQAILLGGLVLRKNRAKIRRSALTIGIFAVLSLGMVAWLGGSDAFERLTSINQEARAELSGGTRLQIDRDAIRMFSSRPLLGWGLGTFADAYPQFRSFYTDFSVNAAHNDFLQFLAETGILGFAAMLWFVFAMFRAACAKLGRWSMNTNGGVALAAMLGCTGILVHSALDFNLQIPANAALFYALAVVAAIPPRFGIHRHRHEHRAEETARLSA